MLDRTIITVALANKPTQQTHPNRTQLLPYLEGLGYVCPPLFNPADFVLELASAKVIKGQAGYVIDMGQA